MKKPNKYNRRKLKLVLNYIKDTQRLEITLSVGDMPVVKCWVSTSYTVHEYWWLHMESMMSLVKVAVSCFFTKKDKWEEINRRQSDWHG